MTMRRQALISADAAILCFEGTAAPAIPVSFGRVPKSMRNGHGAPSELAVTLEADDNTDLTLATVLAAIRTPGELAITVLTANVSAGANTFTLVGHGLVTGDGPIMPEAVDLPLGLEAYTATGVYVIRDTDDVFKVAASLDDAFAGTAIDITDAGTGDVDFVHSAATRFIRWLEAYVFGGTQALDFREGKRARIPHDSDVEAYSLRATFSAVETVRMWIKPVLPAS